MTVLISNERVTLQRKINHILDIFSSQIDNTHGIFLKPNIVFPVKDRSGEITRLILVKTLINCLRERFPTIDIIIGEGVAAGCNPQENFNTSGYSKLAYELSIPLIDLHNTARKKIQWKFGTLDLPTEVLERNYINLPILKKSSACVISGALKNQKGLLMPNMKKQFHRQGLHEQIAVLNATIQPSLTILDGSRFFGKNVLISGNNSGEIDATVCELLGIEEPEHVRLAREVKVFHSGYEIIKNPGNIRLKQKPPQATDVKQIGKLRLWSNPQACTMCRYIFHDFQRNILKKNYFLLAFKFLKYSVIGAEIIWGKNPNWQKKYKTVICFGTCTQQIVEDTDCIFIPGCPPTIDDLYKNLP